MNYESKKDISNFRFERAEDFNPAILGRSLCMDFDAVVSSFTEDPGKRVKGALGSYIYDIPQYAGDRVDGGIHYAQYVRLPTSLIPQKQPSLLKQFASTVREYAGSETSFFDLGPGPEWSVARNTIPSLQILNPSAYFAVDIEFEFIEEACKAVAREFPGITVKSIALDFHTEVLPYPELGVSVVWYPGSTLGNLPSMPGQTFTENKFVANHLKQLSSIEGFSQESGASERYLVLLMDSRKEEVDDMVNLYVSPEARGCFISILFKLRRDLQAKAFNPDAFVYNPCWNEESSAVEHVFTALETQKFTISDCFTRREAVIKIHEGENYVLANSIKPGEEEMRSMLFRSGWEPLESQRDTEGQFHIHLARASTQS
ncbi:MAG: L-histidine N(alpha)-methyltransferase [Nostocaceae cyanobacterium]|nr:L-histidine N(alpha)-methyltransferase [Nostocaceae cyanobacterium]